MGGLFEDHTFETARGIFAPMSFVLGSVIDLPGNLDVYLIMDRHTVAEPKPGIGGGDMEGSDRGFAHKKRTPPMVLCERGPGQALGGLETRKNYT